MQNPRRQYNILNKDICKNSKDYVSFSQPGFVVCVALGEHGEHGCAKLYTPNHRSHTIWW